MVVDNIKNVMIFLFYTVIMLRDVGTMPVREGTIAI